MKDYSDIIGKTVSVKIDRPLGTYHPRINTIFYTVNYGYVEGVLGGDGHEQDVYLLGVDVPVQEYTGVVIAVIRRLDDVEDKWVVAPEEKTFTKEEIEKLTYFVEQYFEVEIIC